MLLLVGAALTAAEIGARPDVAGDGCWDAGRTSEPGGGVDIGAAAGGGSDGGAYETGPGGADEGGREATFPCGYGASSGILAVGASRGAAETWLAWPVGLRRAPQPPQNRESGAFSVPQVGQRIPPSA